MSAAEALKAARAGIWLGIDGTALLIAASSNGSTAIRRAHRRADVWAAAQAEQAHDPLLPFGIESSGHAWLHSRCWEIWHAKRKAKAVATLSPFLRAA